MAEKQRNAAQLEQERYYNKMLVEMEALNKDFELDVRIEVKLKSKANGETLLGAYGYTDGSCWTCGDSCPSWC